MLYLELWRGFWLNIAIMLVYCVQSLPPYLILLLHFDCFFHVFFFHEYFLTVCADFVLTTALLFYDLQSSTQLRQLNQHYQPTQILLAQ